MRSAERNDDKAEVPVSLRTAHSPDLSAGIDARQRRRRIAEGGNDRLDLARRERITEPRAPRGAVEEHDGPRRAVELLHGLAHSSQGATNGRLGLLFADIHWRVRLDSRRADQTASGGATAHVSRTDIAP
jgi:hypothetical protein